MNLDIPSKSPEGLLHLLCLRGIGQRLAVALAKRFSVLAAVMEADDAELLQVVNGSVVTTIRDRRMWESANSAVMKIYDEAFSHSTRILSCFCDEYPDHLKALPDLPAILYVKGRLRNDNRFVACVGTREPSYFGTMVAHRMTKVLSEAGWGIISGLAIGIDSECHTAALAAGGYTAAVLANGLDSIYPKSNQRLAEQIVESGGALVTEQPPGTRALGHHLVQRDRLQSGMSLATFVMQTDIVGGTMHTVRFTLTQGRLLFVPVPTEKYANEEKSRGLRALVEMTGREFADKIAAEGAYRKLLQSKFGDRALAIPIRSLRDYDSVLNRLNEAFEEYRVNGEVGK